MYTRIIVPLDGSDLAEQILPYVQWLGKSVPSSIELLRIVAHSSADLTDSVHEVYRHRVSENIKSAAQDYLGKIAVSLREQGLTVATSVHEGEPASSIVRGAERGPDALIAMSTHGRSGIARWLFGSVTYKLLHTTANPLLIVRSLDGVTEPDVELKTVLVPLDGSTMAEGALSHVVPLAKALSLKVYLVRVEASLGEYQEYMAYRQVDSAATVYAGPIEEFSKEAGARAMGYLHGIKEKLVRQGVFSIEEHLLQGHAAGTIVDFARDTPGCMVAMSTHGRSGVERWVLGSVADRVARHSGVPVLIIRGVQEEARDFPNLRPRPL